MFASWRLGAAELRGFDPSFSIVGPLFYGNGAQHLGAGFVPSPSRIFQCPLARCD